MQVILQRFVKIVMSTMPFVIIMGLLGAALFIKPKAVGKSIEPPVIERRDRFYGIAVPEPGVIWIAGSGGKILRSDDNGKSWTPQNTPVVLHLQDISAWDSRRAVAVGNEGIVLITEDDGASWKEVQAPKSSVANKLIRVKTYPDGTAWAIGEMGAVLVSRDYGATWNRRSTEEDVGWNDIAFVDSRIGWVVGEFGRMLHTRNGGESWRQSSSPVQSSLMGIGFRDDRHGVAVGMEGVVIHTDDGGRTWRTAEVTTNVHLFDVAWMGDSWRAVGGKGISLVGVASGSAWKMERLSNTDMAWHTAIIRRFGVSYIAGGTTGSFENGIWTVFKSS